MNPESELTRIELEETAKYERVWKLPEYRRKSHSLELWEDYRGMFPPFDQIKTAIDIGCGLGVLFGLWNESGIAATAIDIAHNAIDPAIKEKWGHRFYVGSLWDGNIWGECGYVDGFDTGVCADVMEHLPPAMVPETLKHIGANVNHIVFGIAECRSTYLREELHLTIQPSRWWEKQIAVAMPEHEVRAHAINRERGNCHFFTAIRRG